jgi:HK97 family phage major capsid protein
MKAKLIEKRDAVLASAEAIVAAAKTQARDLTSDEDAQIAKSLEDVRDLDAQIERHTELETRAKEAADLRAKNQINEVTTKVVAEPRTYRANGEHSFIRDAYMANFNGDFAARERLSRHQQEEKIERRDVTSTNFAGLVVPQFLTDLAAPFARAGRPFMDASRKHQLPDAGLTLSISKVTTGSATAVQTEGAAVQETNMDDTKLDVSVVTVAGQQNVSRQALERGTGIDSLVMADLVSAYHTNLDSLNVTTSATSLTNIITQVVTFTSGSPTVALLYPKLLDAIQRVQTNYFQTPNFVLMHPRRLAFILAAVDEQDRPLAVPTPYGFNPIATGNGAAQYAQSGYSIAGIPVISDANVTITNGAGDDEDVIIVGHTSESHLWEQGDGSPMMLRFEDVKSAELEVKMVVYGYSAYTANRYPNAFALVGGTGLVTPTF